MADPRVRVERLAGLLDKRKPRWGYVAEPGAIQAGTPHDLVGAAYVAGDERDHDLALLDLGIQAGTAAYGLKPSLPGDTLDELTAAMRDAVRARVGFVDDRWADSPLSDEAETRFPFVDAITREQALLDDDPRGAL